MTLKAALTMICIKLKGYQKRLHMEMPHSLRKCELCRPTHCLVLATIRTILNRIGFSEPVDKQRGSWSPSGY